MKTYFNTFKMEKTYNEKFDCFDNFNPALCNDFPFKGFHFEKSLNKIAMENPDDLIVSLDEKDVSVVIYFDGYEIIESKKFLKVHIIEVNPKYKNLGRGIVALNYLFYLAVTVFKVDGLYGKALPEVEKLYTKLGAKKIKDRLPLSYAEFIFEKSK